MKTFYNDKNDTLVTLEKSGSWYLVTLSGATRDKILCDTFSGAKEHFAEFKRQALAA